MLRPGHLSAAVRKVELCKLLGGNEDTLSLSRSPLGERREILERFWSPDESQS